MPPTTKKRSSKSVQLGDVKTVRQKIKELEYSLSDKTHLNNIVDLMEFAGSNEPKIIHASILALHRVFTRFLSNGDMKRPKSEDTTPKSQVTRWLRDQYNDFLGLLRSLLSHKEPGLQVPSLKILMAVLKSESEYIHGQDQNATFANGVYVPIVEAIILNTNFSQPLYEELVEKYLNVYDDLRHYFYKDSADLMKAMVSAPVEKEQPKNKKAKVDSSVLTRDVRQKVAQNVFSIVENIRTMPTEESEIDEFWAVPPSRPVSTHADEEQNPVDIDEDEELLGGGLDMDDVPMDSDTLVNDKKGAKVKLPSLLQLHVHQRSFTLCWITMLRLPLTEDIYKKALLIMHKRVLPHMTDPKLLMDFLTDSYNVGGAVSLLALNGVFTLITDHNLDYPDFYQKLYSLLDRNVMHVKYRSRFFRLLEVFLGSAYLPAALIAAFIKRLARLALSAPPSAIVIIIPFIYNLLKRHPTCMKLIHSNTATGEADDPYNVNESDPYACRAIDSSLWEVQTLTQHYYANVATLAKIFSDKFHRPKYNLEDFLDHTYATFFKTESERKRKRDPAFAFEKPSTCVWEI